jgi:hypothetical protein
MIRGLILVLALAGPAMAQPRTDQPILAVHQVCILRALNAANATLDDPDRPIALNVVLRKYRTLRRAVYDGCMSENGYKLRTDWNWCTANELPRAAFACYEATR